MGTITNELWRLDAVETARLIRLGCISSREATEAALARLVEVNWKLNAVVLPLLDEALAGADACDAARARGEALGPLHGVPVTIKINVAERVLATDHCIAAFKNPIPGGDSAVIRNTSKAGAIIVGYTNSPALGMRFHTDNVFYGQTFNPLDRRISPGGSSGGAAAATAAGIGAIGYGNDMSGSISCPAFCCGIVGLRPSHGRAARCSSSGLSGRPLSTQLMSVDGSLTRTVGDARLALGVMSGSAYGDNQWEPAPIRFNLQQRPLKVALVTSSQALDVQPAAVAAVRRAGAHLAKAGYQVEEVLPPRLAETSALWHTIAVTEHAHLLGPLLELAGDQDVACFLREWWDIYPPAGMKRYMTSFMERDALVSEWDAFLEDWPIILMPASPVPPLPAGLDVMGREGAHRTLDAIHFQLIAPVLGLPALAVPVATSGGVPLGIELLGRRFREDTVLDAGEVIEAGEGVRSPVDPAW